MAHSALLVPGRKSRSLPKKNVNFKYGVEYQNRSVLRVTYGLHQRYHPYGYCYLPDLQSRSPPRVPLRPRR